MEGFPWLLMGLLVIVVVLYSLRRTQIQGRLASTAEKIVVTDIQMPFWSMVTFMVKWSIAAIPAIIILMFTAAAVVAMMGGLGALSSK